MRFLTLAGVLLLALESIGASDFGGAENGGADRLSPGYRRVADHLGRARGVKSEGPAALTPVSGGTRCLAQSRVKAVGAEHQRAEPPGTPARFSLTNNGSEHHEMVGVAVLLRAVKHRESAAGGCA
jgi:hypothetical protein